MYWKNQNKYIDHDLQSIVEIRFVPPIKAHKDRRVPKSKDEQGKNDKRRHAINIKAKYYIYYALDKKEFKQISICEIVKDIWRL